jgi:hypothetical protein
MSLFGNDSGLLPTDVACMEDSDTCLVQSLFSNVASWKLISQTPLAEGLSLIAHEDGGFSLRWVAQCGDPTEPSTVVLKVPEQLPDTVTGWRFKAEVGSNYYSSDAIEASDPLATPFFKSLIAKGFVVTSIENAVLPDLNIDIKLGKSCVIRNSEIYGALKLETQELILENVRAENCKIEFNVQTGRWSNFNVKGERSQFIGDAGTTIISDDCHFSGVVWRISLLNVAFEAQDFFKQLNKTTFQSGMLPAQFTERLNIISHEEYQRRVDNAEVNRAAVAEREWAQPEDATDL